MTTRPHAKTSFKKKKLSEKSLLKQGVFGRALDELLLVQGEEVPIVVQQCVRWLEQYGTASFHPRHPSFNMLLCLARISFIDCFNILLNALYMFRLHAHQYLGLNEEGLFRVPGEATHIEKLKSLYDRGSIVAFLIHD